MLNSCIAHSHMHAFWHRFRIYKEHVFFGLNKFQLHVLNSLKNTCSQKCWERKVKNKKKIKHISQSSFGEHNYPLFLYHTFHKALSMWQERNIVLHFYRLLFKHIVLSIPMYIQETDGNEDIIQLNKYWRIHKDRHLYQIETKCVSNIIPMRGFICQLEMYLQRVPRIPIYLINITHNIRILYMFL